MRRRKGRDLNGLLLLDKPAGITSNRVLQNVKKLFNAAKAGHTGSLDPLATGLLIICFGKATKISQYLLNADKQYEVTLKLGVVTNTGDTDGAIVKESDASLVSDDDIRQCAMALTGEIKQIPPMYSALKHQGARLYALARKGIEVERQSRTVNIYKFDLIQKYENFVDIKVHCSKGTYVRKLVEDLGNLLGCGAHVVKLRRTCLGPFFHPNMYTISELEDCAAQNKSKLDQALISIEIAFHNWPALSIEDDLMHDIRNGHPIWIPRSPTKGVVRIYDANDQFYGLGKILEDGRIAPKCLS